MTALSSRSALRGRATRAIRRQFGEIQAVLAGDDFVKDFAEAVEVGLRRARAFRRHEALRAHERLRGIDARHQADVRQLGHAVHEDDVRRFDVAVDQPVACKCSSAVARARPMLQAFVDRQAAAVRRSSLRVRGRVSAESECRIGSRR